MTGDVFSPVVFDRRPRVDSPQLLRHWFSRPKVKPRDPFPQLRVSIADVEASAAQTMNRAKKEGHRAVRELSPEGEESFSALLVRGLLDELEVEPDDPWLRRSEAESKDNFRVVLMGRTQAGKSTLLEYLTAGDGSRIGDGRQRFSRDVCERAVPHLDGVVVIDTPGVGARDGEEDFRAAFAEIPRADLVLWVMGDDPEQEQTVRALQLIAVLGKPVIAVLNCRADLTQQHKKRRFLDHPETTFRDSEEHFELLRRNLAEAGGVPVSTVALHAQAAFDSLHDPENAQAMLANSRVGALIDKLAVEQQHLARQRRALRFADSAREPIAADRVRLEAAGAQLLARQELHCEEIADLSSRINRVLDGHSERLAGRISEIVGSRRTWHHTIDPEHAEREWDREATRLQSELIELFEEASSDIDSELEQVVRAVSKEWDFATAAGLGGLPGFGSVWMNRAARLGLAAAVGVAAGYGVKAGATAGAFVGGPVGAVVGGALGALLGAGLGWSSKFVVPFIEGIFRSRDDILRRRRSQLGQVLAPKLTEVESKANEAKDHLIGHYRDQVTRLVEAEESDAQRTDRLAALWANEVTQLDRLMVKLDTAAAQALLTVARPDLPPEAIVGARRMPGVGISIMVRGTGLDEIALFPPPTVEPLIPLAEVNGEPSPTGAARLFLGLTDEAFEVRHVSSTSAIIDFPASNVPEGVLRRWRDFATLVLSGDVVVSSSGSSN